jgi:phospholipid/cholesterol/gamma-HCH transport system substrate-binding protein
MMRTAIRARWARIRVSVTAFVSLSILFTLVYLLTGGGIFQPQIMLRSYFEDSGGLEKGATVRYKGVKIGKVTAVGLSGLNDPTRTVEVRMTVARRYIPQIPRDSKSEISTENVVGDKHIEINPGQSPVPVQENAELAHKPATNVYVRIDVATFTAQLRAIDAVLKDIQEGKGGIGQFVMTDKLYRDLISGVKEVGRQVDAVASTETTMGGLLYSRDAYDNLRGSLQRLDDGLAQIQAGRGSTGRLLRDSAAYDDVRVKLADVNRQVNAMRDTDFIKSDALYSRWNSNVASLIRAVDKFNTTPLLTDVQLYESLLGSTHEMERSVKELRMNPKQFLRMRMKIF